jgi:hypothetical protein
MFHAQEDLRMKNDPQIYHGSPNGHFVLQSRCSEKRRLLAIATDTNGWEHVSVSVRQNNKAETPYWDEMCQVKEAFWDEDDVVLQFHPAKAEYVNCHPNVLHLWRPKNVIVLTPDPRLVY